MCQTNSLTTTTPTMTQTRAMPLTCWRRFEMNSRARVAAVGAGHGLSVMVAFRLTQTGEHLYISVVNRSRVVTLSHPPTMVIDIAPDPGER
jgi:hypothetical protein